jgi:hypothetical protein
MLRCRTCTASLPVLAVATLIELALFAGAAVSQLAAATPEVRLEVEGTEFHVFAENGALVPQDDLIGTLLLVRDENGNRVRIRIDRLGRDPADPPGEIQLYSVSSQDHQTGQWYNMCQPGPDGLAKGFPLSGSWSSDGQHFPSKSFLFTCTSGAIGKCVRFGYKPWKRGPNNENLWDYHQACTRMVRADYCGDGRSWTRDGTLIDVYDRLGIQKAERREGMRFEAAWGSRGAVCVDHTRIPERLTLEELQAMCPERLKLSSFGCTEEVAAASLEEALIMNRSSSK